MSQRVSNGDSTSFSTASGTVFNIGVAGVNTNLQGDIQTPAYPHPESSPTINPCIFVQDANGVWHPQAGIDTVTGNTGFPFSGPKDPQGTLTWFRRMFFRDNAAPSQGFKNAFLSVQHSAGVGTAHENQDRALALSMGNVTGNVTAVTIAGGVVTLNVSTGNGGMAPGQVIVTVGLSKVTQLNFLPLTITGTSGALTVTAVSAPLCLETANNASNGSTVYAQYVGQPANAYANQTFVVTGFNNAVNNGTFLCTASSGGQFTLNNPSGVFETPPNSAKAVAVLTDTALTSDTGTIDQYMHGMEGVQCEMDLVGTPTFTSAIDGEVSAFSAQTNLLTTGVVNAPALGFTCVRASLYKSGTGTYSSTSIPGSSISGTTYINNAANNGFATYCGVSGQVIDQAGGAPSTFGIAIRAGYAGTNRVTTANYGLYAADFTQSYIVTSVSNASGGTTGYTGIFPGGNALAGQNFKVTGLNAANNGVYQCAFHTTSVLTLKNANGVAQTATVRIQALSDYALYVAGGQTYIGGNLTFYNGQTTAGNGMAVEVGQIVVTGLTANYNAGSVKTIYTPTAASQLRISYSQAITTAATTTSTLPSLVLGWTDVGGIARTKTIVPTDSTNTTTVEYDGVAVITTNTSTAVTITSANYASNTAAQMVYALSVTTEVI